jgi:hypothetical protein
MAFLLAPFAEQNRPLVVLWQLEAAFASEYTREWWPQDFLAHWRAIRQQLIVSIRMVFPTHSDTVENNSPKFGYLLHGHDEEDINNFGSPTNVDEVSV